MAKRNKAVEEPTVNDPVFGKLIYDGFHHHGWGGSVVDPRFTDWGSAVAEVFPDRDEEEDDENEPKDGADDDSSAEDFLSQLLSVAGDQIKADLAASPEAAKMLEATRAFAARVDAYDGSLDADKLRKAGRIKVCVRNDKATPPTPAQQAAWQAFKDGGDDLAEQIAAALLKVYNDQRPERLRWWASLYGDSPDRALPAVTTTQQMRTLMQPDEFRVYPEQNGAVVVALIFTVVWADKNIKVSLHDGKAVAKIGIAESDHGLSSEPDGPLLDSPVFGRLQWFGLDEAWIGTFHCEKLRGYAEASELRYNFKTGSGYHHPVYRSLPGWDVITADSTLTVLCEDGDPPSPGQEAAWAAFTNNLDQSVDQALKAIFDWYIDARPDWLEQMNGDEEDKNVTMPPVTSPADLSDFIEFSGVRVLPSTYKDKRPCVILDFGWFDEHGLAVRWREGRVEKVADFDTVEDD